MNRAEEIRSFVHVLDRYSCHRGRSNSKHLMRLNEQRQNRSWQLYSLPYFINLLAIAPTSVTTCSSKRASDFVSIKLIRSIQIQREIFSDRCIERRRNRSWELHPLSSPSPSLSLKITI